MLSGNTSLCKTLLARSNATKDFPAPGADPNSVIIPRGTQPGHTHSISGRLSASSSRLRNFPSLAPGRAESILPITHSPSGKLPAAWINALFSSPGAAFSKAFQQDFQGSLKAAAFNGLPFAPTVAGSPASRLAIA